MSHVRKEFAYGALTRSGGPFQVASTPLSRSCGTSPTQALQPRTLERVRFGLIPFRSPLLGESRLISLPPGTEMFQFPGLALPCRSDGVLTPPGFPIRTPADQRMRAPPRIFSQLATSFFAGLRQGIPRALLHRLATLLPKRKRQPHLSAQGARSFSNLSAHSDTHTVKQRANMLRAIV